MVLVISEDSENHFKFIYSYNLLLNSNYFYYKNMKDCIYFN